MLNIDLINANSFSVANISLLAISNILVKKRIRISKLMLYFIQLEGLALVFFAIYILFRSTQIEKGLWRITASRAEKMRS